ncbi:MAG: rhamnogalacturonidase, partial [Candidatus Saccharimonadales bacterium]
VYLPAGNYLSGSIHLKSNISLFIDQGAVIIAAPVTAENGYDEAETSVNTTYQDYGHSHWHNSLIWGEKLHDISIVGQGMIWGKGLYRDYVKGSQSANKSIALYLCRNVNIQDITILHGGWFAILATGVDNLTISNVKLDTNRDGMDIDCCRNVHVSDCSVNSPYDDGICLKSTFGLGFARATENVTITNCEVSGFDEGSFLDGTYKTTLKNATGRIKFGTESNGGFKNITISNCVFNHCRGLALETVDGALLEDVTISNITMRDIVNAPIFLRLGARMRGPAGTPVGELRRIIISNIVAYNVEPGQGVLISGIPGHPIKDVDIKDVKIYYKGGGTPGQAARQVPEMEKGYPEPGSFGITPAYGFFVRHAEGIKLENIDLNLITGDQRPAFM